MKTLNWSQLVSSVGVIWNDKNSKDISTLVTFARQAGIGDALGFQKTTYSDKDLIKMRKLIHWWRLLNDNSAGEWRNKETSSRIQKIISGAVSKNIPVQIYAVFCPSYKKGKGSYGYTGVTGNYTQAMIMKMSKLAKETRDLGVKIKATAFFSDLLLENFEKLKDTNYKQDLEANFQDFRKRFQAESCGLVETRKLSSIDDIFSGVGEVGITTGGLDIPNNIYDRVRKRNEVFYRKVLGWTNDQIIKRSETLARSYSFMGDVFRRLFPEGIMYWVESAYERGPMYSGTEQDNPIPIIYPIKNES